jgi:hypothetical protein
MNKDQWKHVYESYLYDDFFLNSIAGRYLNFKPMEDSCVFNIKSRTEVDEKLNSSAGRLHLESIADHYTIAYKVTDLVYYIQQLTDLYPGMKMVAIYRNFQDTVSSILEKKWFTDEAISIGSPDPMNFRLIYKNKRIPFWVKEDDYDFWINSDEINRSTYYFLATNRVLSKNMDRCILVSYDNMVKNAQVFSAELAEALNVSKGDLTDKIVDSIRPRGSKRLDFMNSVDKRFVAEINELELFFNNLLQHKSILIK